MSITPANISDSNILFVYREDDEDSYLVAMQYWASHDLMSGEQFLSIPCSNTEILPDYAAFKSQVEDPITSYLSDLSFSSIILGYNIPGGFIDVDTVSSVSRISRIYHTYAKKANSYVYNRKNIDMQEIIDDHYLIPCSRVDAQNVILAKSIVDNCSTVNNQHYLDGAFIFSPNSGLTSPDAITYKNNLLFFYNNFLPQLHINNILIDNGDVSFPPYLTNDSIYWGWMSQSLNNTFFRETTAKRFAFYNADNNSVSTIKSATSLASLSTAAKYSVCLGAMSDPSILGYLQPTPFFNALLSGCTVGEAYLLSNRYLDWTNTIIGDSTIRIGFK